MNNIQLYFPKNWQRRLLLYVNLHSNKKLKSITAILLASVFILQSAVKLLIMADYEINKDYISKNLCENKAKPMMHCNGKCHLHKQLAQQEKKENSLPYQNLKDKFQLQYFSKTVQIMFNESTLKQKPNFAYSFFIPLLSETSIFHPPQT